MGKFLIATLLGAFGFAFIGDALMRDNSRDSSVSVDQAAAPMAYAITGAIFGASCVWVARWEQRRRK